MALIFLSTEGNPKSNSFVFINTLLAAAVVSNLYKVPLLPITHNCCSNLTKFVTVEPNNALLTVKFTKEDVVISYKYQALDVVAAVPITTI